MEFGGKTLKEAVQFTIHERLEEMEGSGGRIAIDKDGNIVVDFNAAEMYRGYKKDEESKVSIYRQD